MTDARSRFTTVARPYDRFRPSYPDELFAWIESHFQRGKRLRVADIGSGTGISSRLWASRGHGVVGVEPNDAMRTIALRRGEGPRYVKGEASATGLAGGRFHVVAAAQAFHWFELEPTLREWRRLLAEDGRACAFWNLRRATSLLRDYEALLRRLSRDYREQPHGRETFEALKARPDAQASVFANSQTLDQAGLIGRALSTSYVALGVRDLEGFKRELGVLFERHQRRGRVAFDHDCAAVLWRP